MQEYPATPPKILGGILEKIYLFKVLFLKNGVNKWMQLVVLLSIRHSWPKKGIPPTPKVKKNYKWWFVRTFHLSSMRIKNNNLPWRYQSCIQKNMWILTKCGYNHRSKWVSRGSCGLPITNRVTGWEQTHHRSLWLTCFHSWLSRDRGVLTNHELLNQARDAHYFI
jgi:hypothetical protein